MGTHVEKLLQATPSRLLEIGEKSVLGQLLEGHAVSPRSIRFSLFQNTVESEKQDDLCKKAINKNQFRRQSSLSTMHRNTKRRLTFSGFQDVKHPARRRRRVNSVALPTKFLLGGDITDPLNLKSLADEDVNRRLNALTPISSPIPMSTHHTEIEVLIPPNIYDPLNLNTGEEIDFNLMSSKTRKRKFRRQHSRHSFDQKEESENSLEISNEEKVKAEITPYIESKQSNVVAITASPREFLSSSCCTSSVNRSESSLSIMFTSSSLLENPVICSPRDQSKSAVSIAWTSCRSPGGQPERALSITLTSSNSPSSAWSSVDQPESALAIAWTSSSSPSSGPKPTISLEKETCPSTVKAELEEPDNNENTSDKSFSNEVQLKCADSEIPLCHHPKPRIDLSEASTETKSDKIVSPVVPQGAPQFYKKPISKGLKFPSQIRQFNFKSRRKRFWQKRDLLANVHFKESDEKYCNGSFPYHYRCNLNDDTRLTLFSQEMFYGKEVLDIGCNVGCLSMNIAEHFSPAKVVGIDICPKAIEMAHKHLQHHINRSIEEKERFPCSMASMYGPLVRMALPSNDGVNSSFPYNISFHVANYVPDSDDEFQMQQPEYDIILCLRVTKWVHLNFGDEGLKRLFKRIFSQLRCGGHLILEPQSWLSYRKKKKLSPKIYMNYKSIQMRPEKFINYLLSTEVGFSSCKILGRSLNNRKGIMQPLFILTKRIDFGLSDDMRHSNMVSPVVFNDIEWSGCYNGEENSSSEWEENVMGEDYQEDLHSFQEEGINYDFYQENQMLMDNYFFSPECDNSNDT